MAAGEEIDLTGLDKQIKDVQKDIEKLSKDFDLATRNIVRFGDLSEKTNVNVFKNDLSATNKTLKDFRKELESGNADAVKSFQQLIEQLRTLKGTASELGMTNVIEQLNKIQNASAQAGATAATTILNSLKQSSVYAKQTSDSQQQTSQSASQAAIETQKQANAQKNVADAADKTASNTKKILGSAQSLGKVLQQIQEKKVLSGDQSAIQSYLKQEMSIKRINNALAGLRAAQENCNLATKKGQQEYAKLGQQIKSLEFMLGRNANIAERLSSAFSKSKSMVEQLAMSFGVMTGVFGATNFVKQLYKITAEFQLQQRALGAIIQNTREANVLFKQMQSLAVESPMKFMDLNRYAKQLAAFRIETTNLYDSLKMLGDIAVGVGVDMDRLILAYGQVKAANYLRGQELRQFSEAGVNILGGLQEYYRETKNINLSINEIFDSVSKRKVLFEDVDAVLKRMTQSGGEFYNMQLIQSQTLYGQLQKLGDLFQISMNKIGTSTSGMLLKIITSIQFLIKHLREVVSIMIAIVGARFATKIIRNISTIRGGLVGINIQLSQALRISRMIGSTKFVGLVAGLRSSALAANALSIGLQAAAAAVAYFISRRQEAKAREEETKRALLEEITEYNKRMSEVRDLEKAFNKDATFDGRLALFQQLIEKAKEYRLALKIDEKIDASNIDKNFREATRQLEEYTQKVLMFKSALYTTDVNDALENLNKVNTAFAETTLAANNMINSLKSVYQNLSADQQAALDEILKIDDAFRTNNKEILDQIDYTEDEWSRERLKKLSKLAKATQDAYAGAISPLFGGEKVGGLDEYQDEQFKSTVKRLGEFTSMYEKELKKAEETLAPKIREIINPANFIGVDEETLKKRVYEMLPPLMDAFADAGEFAKQNIPEIVQSALGMTDEVKTTFAKILVEYEEGKTDVGDPEWKKRVRELIEEGTLKTELEVEISEVKATPIGPVNDALNQLQQTYEETFKKIKLDIAEFNVDNYESTEAHKKALDDKIKDIQHFVELYKDAAVDFKFVNLMFGTDFSSSEEAKKAMKDLEEMLTKWRETLYGKATKTTHSRTQSMKSEYQSMIDFVRELNREFDTLRKNFNEKDSARWAGATNRILSSFEAKFGAMPAKFKKAFQDTLSSIDFTTKEGTVEAENIVKGLIDSAKDLTKKEKEELQRAWGEAVGQIKLEAELELKAREDERLKAQVQKMFDDYNLTIELDKLGVDADEVGKLFNIDTKDLLTLERKLESMKEKFVGRKMEKEYRQFMRKIVEINDKANLEMAKKYVKYLREEYGERAKVELEYMRQRAEVYALPFDEKETMRILDNLQKETQKKLDEIDWKSFTSSDMYVELFEDLNRATVHSMEAMKEQLNMLKSSLSSLDPSNLKTIVDQIDKLDDELTKRDPFKVLTDSLRSWRDFKKSDKTESLINEILGTDGEIKMRDFRKTLNKALDEIQSDINRATKDKNIWDTITGAAKSRDEAKKWVSEHVPTIRGNDIYDIPSIKKELDKYEKLREETSRKIQAERAKELKNMTDAGDIELSFDEKEFVRLNKIVSELSDLYSSLSKIKEKGKEVSVVFQEWLTEQGISIEEVDLSTFEGELSSVEEILKKLIGDQNELENGKKHFDKIGEAAIEAGNQLAEMATNMKNAYTSINEYLESIGVATDVVGEAWKEFGNTMFDTIIRALQMIPQMVASIVSAETAINAAAGWIGLIAEAITLVMGLAKSLAGLHDSYQQAEIEKLQKSLDKLEKTAEDLSEAFESSYAEEELRQLDAALIRTRELAISTLEEMKEAEEAKKKSDQAVIDDYQNQIDSLNKEMQEGIENFYEALGGFGSAENMKSAVESWTDAWYEAFKETGDGLSGLEDSFEEFFENIVKKTLMNNIMARYFGEDFLASLDTILGTEGGVMGNLDALNDWINQYHELAVQADEEMQAATQAIQNVTGIGGGLEGLQAGLQGMTEETADILAAYLNSVRFYVADNNQLLQNLLSGLTIDNNSNPILQQLKIVAAQTTSINLLLDSVVHSGGYQGNGGGSYLKVHAILES